jgi:hypothetical protein
MFIKWIERERKTPKRGDTGEPGVTWHATIAEAYRLAGDAKPKQRHVAVVASIAELDISSTVQRAAFWQRVRERLDELGQGRVVPAEERGKLEAKIAERVPR